MTTKTYLYPSNSNCKLADITAALARNDVKKVLQILNTVTMKHCINDTIREDKPGWTLLHDACFNGIPDLCLELILKGANVNCQDSTGSTPLHDAVRNGHITCIKILFDQGAKIGIKTSTGETAYDIASTFSDSEIKTDICNYLVRKSRTNSHSSNSSSNLLRKSFIKKLENDIQNNKGEIKENKKYYCKGYNEQADYLKHLGIQIQELKEQLQCKCCCGSEQADHLNHMEIQIQELKEQLQSKCCCEHGESKIKTTLENADKIAANEACRKVQSNFVLLADRLRTEDHVYDMFQDGYLKHSDLAEIQDNHGEKRKAQKMLLILLQSKKPDWVKCFRNSLTNNSSTLDLVERVWGDEVN